MSLVRLLTAGKSLVGLKGEQVRYRMSDPRALPKFGSSKNPFQSRPVQAGNEDAPGQVGQGGAANGSSAVRANRGLVVEAAGSSRSVPVDLPLNGVCEPRRVSEVCGLDNSDSLRKSDAPRLTEPSTEQVECTGEPTAAAVPLTPALSPRSGSDGAAASGGLKQWLSNFKALVGVGQLRPGRKPGPARGITQPVQGELSLENIKVLRNDLSDTDLEIVTKPPRPQQSSATPKANRENAVPSETAWDRVATLFGAEK